MKNSHTFRRTKRSRRSRKTNKKRYTRGGYTNKKKTGVIDYEGEPNSPSPGPEWSFSFSYTTEQIPLHRVGAMTEEKTVKRLDNRGWDLYVKLL
jgi:hypothetical protein